MKRLAAEEPQKHVRVPCVDQVQDVDQQKDSEDSATVPLSSGTSGVSFKGSASGARGTLGKCAAGF